ncbi:MAG TPA: DUF3035 domain-containing protein [Acetobacteraceae bacterium]|jgi:hypothetical protein|nr:DUF3035 domain-containing protein [Acetobacteraceae bacterium]
MPRLTRACPTVLALAACAAALAACNGSQLERTLGLVHDAPDEFTVTTRAPLAMPPSFELPPPTPGVSRPQEVSERTQAELALVPQMALGTPSEGSSPGQQALVQAAGPSVGTAIRTEVDQEARSDRPSKGIGDRLMFWRAPPQPGIVVDPEKEAKRLRENAALGQSQETGDTPIVQPKQRGWLEGLF